MFWLLSIVIVLIHGIDCFGIYEDQVGKFEWIRENIGMVTMLKTKLKNNLRPKFGYVYTQQGALARIHLKSSKLEWRQIISKEDALEDMFATEAGLLSVSNNGKNIRMWNELDGALLWTQQISKVDVENHKGLAIKCFDLNFGKTAIAIGTSAGVLMLNAANAVVLWDYQAAEKEFSPISIEYVQDGGNVVVLAKIGSSKHAVITFDAKSGSKIKQVELDASHAVLMGSHVVHGSDPLKELVVSTLENDKQVLHVKTSDMDASLGNVEGILPVGVNAFQLVQKGGETRMVRFDHGKLIPVGGDDNGSIVMSSGNIAFWCTWKVNGEAKYVNLATGEEYKQILPVDKDIEFYHGKLENVLPMVYENRDGNIKFKTLMVMEDHGLVHVSKNKVQWILEEGLASIQQAEWVTPEDPTEKVTLSKIPSFLEALAIQWKNTKGFVQNFSLKSLVQSNEEKSHFFGFKKLIIVMTTPGKLYALESETGSIVWSTFFKVPYKMLVTRDHPGLEAGPEIVLFHKSSDTILWIDADTGHTLHSMKSSDKQHVFMLPQHENHVDQAVTSKRIIAIVNDNLDISIVPNDQASIDEVNAVADKVYFHIVDNNQVAGYKIVNGSRSNFRAVQVWGTIMESKKLESIAYLPPNEVVDSPVTIAGDGSLLLKYLNPHLVGIITSSDKNELHVTVLDTVTGRIMHRIEHKEASAPVHFIQSENWFFYSFWNQKFQRTEVASLAFYDGSVHSHGLNLFKRPKYDTCQSSFAKQDPIVLQKSFIFPTGIKAMASTVTAQGITPKHIIVGLTSGQLFMMPRRVLDPRRPETKPTLDQQSEGLVRYSPYVPVYNMAKSMFSHTISIGGLENIVTAPASLESTTLVLAYGLDLYYNRLAPAMSFDILPSDFKYELLLLLVLGLAVASTIMRWTVSRKRLNEAWQ